MKRRIGVITGTRAEYGLLYWIIQEIMNDPTLELQLFVTGMHLSPEFGLTYKLIEQDNIPITSKIEMLLSSDTPVGISKSTALAVSGFAEAFDRHQPDVVVVLGDRFETFAAATAALIARIPVAHCHGGEVTEGAVDEAFRHSITKMSHLHFAATEKYRSRIIQLGENPANVYCVGAPGLEGIKRSKLLDRQTLATKIGFTLDSPTFMVTFHPVTLEHATADSQVRELLMALDHFIDRKIIFTKPNADTDGRIIGKLIDDYVKERQGRCVAFNSMGQLNYLSALQFVEAVIGNSSSGIIEAPSFHKPTVNIGDRQRGRVKPDSVIDCEPRKDDIIDAIKKATDTKFVQSIADLQNPYDGGNPAAKIKDILKHADLHRLVKKQFHDRP
jgi:GDP/UDP-N,N'-diacetylbacillosamine 2-epimerase (hydrolysing)